MTHRKSQIANAFTLVELLIVIGIIAILIGILIPVVNSARKSAYMADSRNQIQVISNAIDRYYTDFSAYPGAFTNAQISISPFVTVSYNNGTSTVSQKLSSTESAVLSLCGGMSACTVSTATAAASDVGRGPLTFNAVQQRRLSPYLEATPQILSISGSSLDPAGIFGNGEAMGVNTGVPEFIDRYPQAMPIIYLRAKVGAQPSGTTVVDGTGNLQYNYTDMAAYGLGSTPPSGSTFTTWNQYFQNASLSSTVGVAKRQDTYMLISPGPDRKFGTSDDICNFSF